jgi:hypothetical protein
MVCNIIFDDKVLNGAELFESPRIHQVMLKKYCPTQDWTVIVFEEPRRNGRIFIESYLQDIADQINQIKRPERVLVFFHFSSVLRNPPSTEECAQRRYPNLEQNLRQLLRVGISVEIQVWGFHRVAGLWDTLINLPHWLQNLDSLIPPNPHARSPFPDFIAEVEKALKGVEVSELVKNLSILKHRIMHMFSPVDNDLQMLWDENVRSGRKGFNTDKWREIMNIYKDVDWKINFCEALRLIKETINEINKDLKGDKKQKAQEISKFVKKAKAVLKCEKPNNSSSKSENIVDLMRQAFCLLQKLKPDKMQEVYDDLKKEKGPNPVHEWLVKLDDMLEELI